MVNCNPETVSTDDDTSDRLFFEPLFPEDVLAVCRRLQERGDQGGGEARRCRGGVGRTDAAPSLAPHPRSKPGSRCSAPAPTRSTWPRTASASTGAVPRLGIEQPPGGTRHHHRTGPGDRRRGLGFPVLVRPSYVLGGRAMQIVYDDESLVTAMARGCAAGSSPSRREAELVRRAAGARLFGSSRMRWRSTSARSATPPASR